MTLLDNLPIGTPFRWRERTFYKYVDHVTYIACFEVIGKVLQPVCRQFNRNEYVQPLVDYTPKEITFELIFGKKIKDIVNGKTSI